MMSDDQMPHTLVLPCIMSGNRETLRVKVVGSFGLCFKMDAETSVILDTEGLRTLRDVIDRQIKNKESHNTE